MAQRDSTKGTAGHSQAKPERFDSFDSPVDAFLDEALDETFPASDPVAVTPPPRRRRFEPDRQQR